MTTEEPTSAPPATGGNRYYTPRAERDAGAEVGPAAELAELTEAPVTGPPAPPATLPRERHEELAALLAPMLRDAAGGVHGDLSDFDVLVDARPLEVIDALYYAGLLVHDEATDRAHLRKSWAAMSTALIHLAERRPLDAAVLAAVPQSHQVYLLGHQARAAHLDDAHRQILAGREALDRLLSRGTPPSPVDLGRVLALLGGTDPYADGRPLDADPWWGAWLSPEAADPETFHWERFRRTCSPDRQIDGLGDLCMFLGGTWSESAESSSITAGILRLIVKAQATPERFSAIARAFPREVLAWKVWMGMSPSPTAGELYLELTGTGVRAAGEQLADAPEQDDDAIADLLARLHSPDYRPEPVYAANEDALPGQIAERAAAYVAAIGEPDSDGARPVDRDKLRPADLGDLDLRAQLPDGARAYALPWPAGTRAMYHPVDGVGMREIPGAGPLTDAEVVWRDLFVVYGDGAQLHVGRVRRLTAADIGTGSRYWSCRHCCMGATGAANATAERAEAMGHEAICPDQDRVRAAIPAGEDRFA
jgi:hypothetical protein